MVPKRIVRLGDVGADRAYRSKMLAKRFPKFNFYSIDLRKIDNIASLKQKIMDHPKLDKLKNKRLKVKKPGNLEHIQADFIKGLNKFEDNSLDLITSDFAVGYYKYEESISKLRETEKMAKTDIFKAFDGSREYTKDIINLAYSKLKPKGKIIIYYFTNKNNSPGKSTRFENNVLLAFQNSPFKYKAEKVDSSKIPANLRSTYLLLQKFKGYSIHRVIAIKE